MVYNGKWDNKRLFYGTWGVNDEFENDDYDEVEDENEDEDEVQDEIKKESSWKSNKRNIYNRAMRFSTIILKLFLFSVKRSNFLN